MTVGEKLQAIAQNQQKIYDAGYEKGKANDLIRYVPTYMSLFQNAVFPDNFDLTFELQVDNLTTITYLFFGAKNLNTVKLIYKKHTDNAIGFTYAFRAINSLTEIDLTEFENLKISNLSYTFFDLKNLVSIKGALDLSQCTNTTHAFGSCSSLTDIEFVPNSISMSISFGDSSELSIDSVTSIINGLADLTDKGGQTVTFHKDLTITDEQKANINAKNWSLVQI